MSLLETKYAPAERLPIGDVKVQNRLITEDSLLKEIFSNLPEVAVIVNEHRQVIYSNEGLMSLLPPGERDGVLGTRPGEILNCIYSTELPGGCGTTENCRYCGLVNAVLETQKTNERSVKECRIVSFVEDDEVSYDFRVTTSPVIIKGAMYIMVFMNDISSEKRKLALERIFFHDIINTAGGITGFSEFLMQVDDPNTLKEYVKVVDQLSHDLLDELQSQRALTMAESGDLSINPSEIDAAGLLDVVKSTVSYHVVADGKEIVIISRNGKDNLISDPVLLKRVIINMAKNALEATAENGTIELGYITGKEGIVFSVHNSQFMPREVQLQVFRRSFSTKGSDRGLGTYSIKLLVEKYLKGKVWFETDQDKGTSFYVSVPFNLLSKAK